MNQRSNYNQLIKQKSNIVDNVQTYGWSVDDHFNGVEQKPICFVQSNSVTSEKS